VRVAALLAVAVVVASATATYGFAARATDRAGAGTAQLLVGKRLYRTYCGQCHALTEALAVGFGTANGFGTDGGPSFDKLRVPFNLSVISLSQTFAGHEVLYNIMTLNQVKQVSSYVATVTKHHPVLAKSIYD
jgi:mono/diheme cytochrome c family protein